MPDRCCRPWASWWPPEILLALLPERHQRDRLVQSSPRLPVTLFDETLPAANEGLAILTAPQQIAETLQVSEKTVESHRGNVLSKLGMRDRVELVRYAIRRGLVEP